VGLVGLIPTLFVSSLTSLLNTRLFHLHVAIMKEIFESRTFKKVLNSYAD
jgi:hypothetical protein